MPTTCEAQSKKSGRTVTFEIEVGSNLQEAVALFGEDAVWSETLRAMKISAQGIARNILDRKSKETGEFTGTEEEAIKAASGYKPGAKRERQAPARKEKTLQSLAKMVQTGELTLEQLQERINALMAEAGAAA